MQKPIYQYSATVIKIIDGDTITVAIDCGFRIAFATPLRMNGINAPELKTDAGKKALAYIQTLIAVGDTISIKTFKDPRDKYGRWLADVFTASGENVNQAMVDSGNAVFYA